MSSSRPRRRLRRPATVTRPAKTTTGTIASSHHQLHANHFLPLVSDGCGLPAGAFGTSCPGTWRPASWEARFDGSVLNVFLDRSQDTVPPLNRCVMTEPLSL